MMRRALARNRQRLETAERNANDAARAADFAATDRDAAKQALHTTRLAGKRVTDIIALFDDRHPDGSTNGALLMPFARCLVSGLLWEHRNEIDRDEITLGFVSNVFPTLGSCAICALIAENATMTNSSVGEILGVTIGEVERLSLSMVSPSDMTADEFAQYRRERQRRRDRQRKAVAARSAGKMTLEERRATEAEKKAQLAALAKTSGKTVGQIRRDLKAGKNPTVSRNANLGSARENSSAEFTFASAPCPPRPSGQGAGSGRSSDDQGGREKIATLLMRAADQLKSPIALTGAQGAQRAPSSKVAS